MSPEQAAKLTGPQHYRFAVGLLSEIQKSVDAGEITTDDDTASITAGLAAAQIHATLALAAAVIEVAHAVSVYAPRDDWPQAVDPA